MSQSSKAANYKALKAAGVELERHYRDYTTAELKQLCAEAGLPEIAEPSPLPPRVDEIAEIKEQLAGLGDLIGQLAAVVVRQATAPAPVAPVIPTQRSAPEPTPEPAPVPKLDPREHAGVTLNSHLDGEVLRVDEHGNQWYQNEVNKPGYAKPRGRRVLRDMAPDTITQTITTKDGYTETFEIPGDPAHSRPIEYKVTLPSHQCGIFKAPNLPFRIHIYQTNRGFDMDDVNAFYGGVDLVPDTIKRTYVSSDFCYDITSTIRAINDEYRERVLKKETIR